ncbi:hypothetical protein [Haloplanus salilacus]
MREVDEIESATDHLHIAGTGERREYLADAVALITAAVEPVRFESKH